MGLLGFVLNLLVDNPYTHRLVRTLINEKVKQETSLTVDFKAMKVSVIPPGAELYGFYLATEIAPSEPLITASHVSARLSVWSAILGKIRLSLAEADDLTIIWPPPFGFKGFSKGGETGPPAPAAPPTWPPAFDLPIDVVSLKNAKLYAEIPLTDELPLAPATAVIALVGVDLDLDYNGWSDIRAKIGIHSTNAALRAASLLEETSLETVLVVAKDRLAFPTMRIRGERLNFDGAVTGTFALKDAPAGVAKSGPAGLVDRARIRPKILDALDIGAEGAVVGDLSLLGSFLDLPSTRGGVKGEVKITARAPIASADPMKLLVEGHGKVSDGHLAGFRLFNSETTFHITPEEVAFPAINLIVGDQSIGKGKGVLKVGDAIDFDFHASPETLRLADLLDSLGVDFDLIDTNIESPDLRVFGKSEPFAVNVTATGQFTKIELPTVIYDRTRFPNQPACRLDFHLVVTDPGLDFGGTHGICFDPAKGVKPPMPAPGQITAPSSATATAAVAATGGVSFDAKKGLNLEIRGTDVDASLGQYFAQVPLAGKAETRTLIHGPTSAVVIDNDAKASGIVVHGIPLGTGKGELTVVSAPDGPTLTWRDVATELDGQAGALSSPSGSLVVNDKMPIKAKLMAHQVTPAAMRKIIDGAISGHSRFFSGIDQLEADFEGPLYHPGAWQGRFNAGAYEGELDGERLFDAARAELRNTAKGWSSDLLRVSLGGFTENGKLVHQRAFPFSLAEAEGSGNGWASFGLHPDDHFSLDLDTLPAANTDDQLQNLPFIGGKLKTADVEGAIKLTAHLKGTLEEVQGTFNGAIERPSIFQSPMNSIDFQGFVKNGQLDLVLNHSGGAFEGRMSVDVLKENVPYEWYFNFNRMDLRALGTAPFHQDPRNFLYLTAGWHMKGQLLDWWRSTGELELKDIRAKFVQDLATQTKTMQLRLDQPVTLRFTGTEWRFDDDKDLYLTGRNLQLRVSMPDSHPPERFGVRVESIVDMSMIKEFSPDIDTASGKVRVIAEVKGPVDDPKVRVEVSDLKQNPFIAATWAPVSIGLADLRPAFRNVNMKIVYEDHRLNIETLKAEKGSGSITVNGALDLRPEAKNEDSRIDMVMDDATVIFPVAVLKSFEGQLSGNVSVSGTQFPLKIAGDVKINRARTTKEVDLMNEVVKALRSSSFKTAVKSEKPSFLLDLSVRADQSINIHNKNLQSLLSADLSIKGTDLAPSVTGQVEVDKGKFIYKRDFQITRGLVTFDDPVRPDPSIDILAVSDIDAYRVYIAVNGRASNPVVEFSVDPPNRDDGTPIDKVGILVLLSRGKLPETNASFEQTSRNTATSEVANLILGQYEEPVEKLFDISGQNVVRNVYVDVHPSTDPTENGQPVPRLNLPLDLGEDFDVVFRAEQNAQGEVSAEYNLHENIRLSGTIQKRREDATSSTTTTTSTSSSAAAAGDTQLNLKFRFSFD